MTAKKMKPEKSLGDELIESIEEALANPSSVRTVRKGVDVKKIRKSLKMTQQVFATTFGFSLETLRKWEQGVNSPDHSVASYLICIQRAPKLITKLLHVNKKVA